MGLHFGNGEKSTPENSKEQADQFTDAQHGQFVERSIRDKEHSGLDGVAKQSDDAFDSLPDHIKANYRKTLNKFRQEQGGR